mgnify:CR=1 FL=1
MAPSKATRFPNYLWAEIKISSSMTNITIAGKPNKTP